jgi:hypothetical protein
MNDINNFDDVLNFLNNIYAINNGGCGIAALAMYRWLKNNGQLSPDTNFIFLENDDSYYEKNMQYLKGEAELPTSCYHVLINHDNNKYDSSGIRCYDTYKYVYFVDVDFLVKSINNRDKWCYNFKRNKYIPYIEEILNIDLSDICTETENQRIDNKYYETPEFQNKYLSPCFL